MSEQSDQQNGGATPLPLYWRYGDELLKNAVVRYFNNRDLTDREIGAIGRYLQNWIECPCWEAVAEPDELRTADLVTLRTLARQIAVRNDIDTWWKLALTLSIDPF